MAFISMYPPDSEHLSITINDRAYTSIGGAAVEVEDFDAPVLEANGWTTHPPSLVPGFVEMRPLDSVYFSIVLNGRTYTSIGGAPVLVEEFDAPVLEANGWTTVYMTLSDEGQFDFSQAAQSELIWLMYGI